MEVSSGLISTGVELPIKKGKKSCNIVSEYMDLCHSEHYEKQVDFERHPLVLFLRKIKIMYTNTVAPYIKKIAAFRNYYSEDNTSDNEINFEKHHKIGLVVNKIRHCQQVGRTGN